MVAIWLIGNVVRYIWLQLPQGENSEFCVTVGPVTRLHSNRAGVCRPLPNPSTSGGRRRSCKGPRWYWGSYLCTHLLAGCRPSCFIVSVIKVKKINYAWHEFFLLRPQRSKNRLAAGSARTRWGSLQRSQTLYSWISGDGREKGGRTDSDWPLGEHPKGCYYYYYYYYYYYCLLLLQSTGMM